MATADEVGKLSEALDDLKASFDKTTTSSKTLVNSFDQLHKGLAASPWIKYNESLLQVSRSASASAIPLQSLTKIIDELGKKTSLYSQQQIGELVLSTQKLGSSLTGLTDTTTRYLEVLVNRFPKGAQAANQSLIQLLTTLPELSTKMEGFRKVTFNSADAWAAFAKGGDAGYAAYRNFTTSLDAGQQKSADAIRSTQELGVSIQNLGLKGSKSVAPLLDGMAKIGSLGANNPFSQWFTGLEMVNNTANNLLGTVLKIAGVLSLVNMARGAGAAAGAGGGAGGGSALGLLSMLGSRGGGATTAAQFDALGVPISGGSSGGFFGGLGSRMLGSSASAEAGIGSKLLSSGGAGLKFAGKGLPLIGAGLSGLSGYANTSAETSWGDIFAGAGKSAAGGALVGGGIGAFAGGVGAIPGAIAGALTSGGGELIGAAIKKLTASSAGSEQAGKYSDSTIQGIRDRNAASYEKRTEGFSNLSAGAATLKTEEAAVARLQDLHKQIEDSKIKQLGTQDQINQANRLEFETAMEVDHAIERANELRNAEISLLETQVSTQEQLGALYGETVKDREAALALELEGLKTALATAAIKDPSKTGVEYKKAEAAIQAGAQKAQVFQELAPLRSREAQIQFIDKYNAMTKNSVEILKTMNAPLGQIMQQEGIIVERMNQKERIQAQNVKYAQQEVAAGRMKPGMLLDEQRKLSDIQSQKAQEVQYARRTYLEQMTAQSIGLSSGSYVLPTELPGVMALGGGYSAFHPAGAGERYGGTYTAMNERLAGMAGVEGASMSGDWRNLGEQDTDAVLTGNELLSENNKIMQGLTDALKSLKIPSNNNVGDIQNSDGDLAKELTNH